jgi:hypothetical protein
LASAADDWASRDRVPSRETLELGDREVRDGVEVAVVCGDNGVELVPDGVVVLVLGAGA